MRQQVSKPARHATTAPTKEAAGINANPSNRVPRPNEQQAKAQPSRSSKDQRATMATRAREQSTGKSRPNYSLHVRKSQANPSKAKLYQVQSTEETLTTVKTLKLQQVGGECQMMCEKGTQSLKIVAQSCNLGASGTTFSTKDCKISLSAADTFSHVFTTKTHAGAA